VQTAEEIQQASRVIPFSIWFSTLFNGVLGFAMMIAILFTLTDLDEASSLESTFPFMQIFVKALGSLKGASALVRTVHYLVVIKQPLTNVDHRHNCGKRSISEQCFSNSIADTVGLL
jgi:amino acid transporter